jgi:hypothetical protein
MPVRTRSNNGRFETSDTVSKQNFEEVSTVIPIRKDTLWTFMKILVVALILSPWFFLAARRNTFSNVSQSITEFYDDNFSCASASMCLCEGLKNTTASSEKPFSKNNF